MIEITSVKIQGEGYLVNGNSHVPKANGNIDYEAVKSWLETNIPEPEFTEAELIEQAIAHFNSMTDQFIQDKVIAYNKENGTSFTDINSFSKYATNNQLSYYTISNRFIVWVDSLWAAVRAYQVTQTTIPTDEQFQVILDSVTF